MGEVTDETVTKYWNRRGDRRDCHQVLEWARRHLTARPRQEEVVTLYLALLAVALSTRYDSSNNTEFRVCDVIATVPPDYRRPGWRCCNCQNGISDAQNQPSTSIDAAMSATQPFRFLLGAVLLATLLLFLTPSVQTANCPVMEEQCTTETCSVPNCNCATESPPGGLYPHNVPQLVVFAFIGPLNNDSWYQLQGIFNKKRVNPNGERITMTLFFTEEDTDDYCRAGEFYRDGHEIGVTSINGSEIDG
ncbi:hypothetical protein LSAT2_001790 [Lamellibrachia satsuma]|nr:hypothetical protein LSAT2_001790 [Lamellibrachia satsuma]